MAFTPHKYDSPDLPQLLADAVELYHQLTEKLYAIQERTGIPGLHTDLNSNDNTAGVLERIQGIHDEGLVEQGETTLDAFKAFDEEIN